MTPILTDGPVQVLMDPYGFYDGILAEPLLQVMRLWAARLAPEMTPIDFMVSYFEVLRDIQEGNLPTSLRHAPSTVHNLLFGAFPHLVELVLPERAEELTALWRQTMREVGVRGHHA